MSDQPKLPPGWEDDDFESRPFAEVVDSYIATRDLDERSERYLRHAPRRMSGWLGRESTTADLRPETVRDYLEYRATEVNVGTVYTEAGRLMTVWRWAREQGWCGPCDVPRGELMPSTYTPPAPAEVQRDADVDHVPEIRKKRRRMMRDEPAMRDSQGVDIPVDEDDIPRLDGLDSETPLAVVLKRYLAVNVTIRKARTRDSYINLLDHLKTYLDREPVVADLNDETVARYWRWREEGVSRNTVNGEACTLLAFWRWCARKQLCDDPDVKAPPRQKRRPQALSMDQMRRLFATGLTMPGRIGDVPANVFWQALLHVLWQTGERKGAVSQLKWTSIDLEGGWITYPPETRKFGQEELVRPINADAIAALQELRKHTPGDPFAEVRRSQFYAHFKTLTTSADVPDWCTPHTIRKSVASNLPTLEDARRMLGHSNAAITARNYYDERTRDDRELLLKLPSLSAADDSAGDDWPAG